MAFYPPPINSIYDGDLDDLDDGLFEFSNLICVCVVVVVVVCVTDLFVVVRFIERLSFRIRFKF